MKAVQPLFKNGGRLPATLILIALLGLCANRMLHANEEFTMSPTLHTLDILRQNECWAVAAIACDSVTLSALGTRSQTMAFSARVLAASDARVASPLHVEQYVADHAILESGLAYVVILLCDVDYDGSLTWKVIQTAPLADSDAETAVSNTVQDVTGALDETRRKVQIGAIVRSADRTQVSGLVLHGRISAGDRLSAFGPDTAAVRVDQVLVDDVARTATAGDTCLIILSDPDASLLSGATERYYGLADSGFILQGSAWRVSLAWASLRDEPLPAGGPDFSAAVPRPAGDARVRLRLADVMLDATLRLAERLLPPSSVDEGVVQLDRPLPFVPGLTFSMYLQDQFAAAGTILGPIGDTERQLPQ